MADIALSFWGEVHGSHKSKTDFFYTGFFSFAQLYKESTLTSQDSPVLRDMMFPNIRDESDTQVADAQTRLFESLRRDVDSDDAVYTHKLSWLIDNNMVPPGVCILSACRCFANACQPATVLAYQQAARAKIRRDETMVDLDTQAASVEQEGFYDGEHAVLPQISTRPVRGRLPLQGRMAMSCDPSKHPEIGVAGITPDIWCARKTGHSRCNPDTKRCVKQDNRLRGAPQNLRTSNDTIDSVELLKQSYKQLAYEIKLQVGELAHELVSDTTLHDVRGKLERAAQVVFNFNVDTHSSGDIGEAAEIKFGFFDNLLKTISPLGLAAYLLPKENLAGEMQNKFPFYFALLELVQPAMQRADEPWPEYYHHIVASLRDSDELADGFVDLELVPNIRLRNRGTSSWVDKQVEWLLNTLILHDRQLGVTLGGAADKSEHIRGAIGVALEQQLVNALKYFDIFHRPGDLNYVPRLKTILKDFAQDFLAFTPKFDKSQKTELVLRVLETLRDDRLIWCSSSFLVGLYDQHDRSDQELEDFVRVVTVPRSPYVYFSRFQQVLHELRSNCDTHTNAEAVREAAERAQAEAKRKNFHSLNERLVEWDFYDHLPDMQSFELVLRGFAQDWHDRTKDDSEEEKCRFVLDSFRGIMYKPELKLAAKLLVQLWDSADSIDSKIDEMLMAARHQQDGEALANVISDLSSFSASINSTSTNPSPSATSIPTSMNEKPVANLASELKLWDKFGEEDLESFEETLRSYAGEWDVANKQGSAAERARSVLDALRGMLGHPDLQQAAEYLLHLYHRPQGPHRQIEQMLAAAQHHQKEFDSVMADLERLSESKPVYQEAD